MPLFHYSITPILHFRVALADESPVLVERPVDPQPAANQILLRHRPPVTAIKTEVTIVAESKVTVWRNRESLRCFGEILPAQGITAIRCLGLHHSLKAKLFGFLIVDIKEWRIDSKGISGQPAQALDKIRRTGLRILRYHRNMLGPKNKNIGPMRSDKIIAEFVHENLIAGIDVAARDHLVAFVSRTGSHLEIVRQGRLRSVNPMRPTVGDNARPGKEEEIFLFYDVPDSLVFWRDYVDVIASENDKFGDLLYNIWARPRR